MHDIKIKYFSGYALGLVLLLIALAGGWGYQQGLKQQDATSRAVALLSHIKLLVANVRQEKNDMGEYPVSIDAMLAESEYFLDGGMISPPRTRRSKWQGPYFDENVISAPYGNTKRFFAVDLNKIMPGLRGNLISNNMNDGVIKYLVSAGGEMPEEEINEVFKLAIKQCNREKNPVIVDSYQYTVATGNVYKRCGYVSNMGNLTEISYYIADAPSPLAVPV